VIPNLSPPPRYTAGKTPSEQRRVITANTPAIAYDQLIPYAVEAEVKQVSCLHSEPGRSRWRLLLLALAFNPDSRCSSRTVAPLLTPTG